VTSAAQIAEKGLPPSAAALDLAQVRAGEWNVAAGDLPLPAATLNAAAVEHNIATMATWCQTHGVLLAPHGKTSLAPELFARQLKAGAWGITASTARQAEVAAAAGATRVILANEVLDPVQLTTLGELVAGGVDVLVFVDSATGLSRLAEMSDGSIPRVLVEMGMGGGRTGVRTAEELFELLERVGAEDRVELAGVSAYEALLPAIRRTLPPAFGSLPPSTEAVAAFLEDVRAAIAGALDRGLLASDAIVTAGGSSAFDLVVDALRGVAGPLILRSGCYVAHDHGVYLYLSPLQEGNDPDLPPDRALRPAMTLWAHVVSRPEPDIAIVGFGRRDAGDDFGAPTPLAVAPSPGVRRPVDGWAVAQMWDQHAQMRAGQDATELRVGDVLTFGISHPCTTFDKWRTLAEIDDDDTVLGVVGTWF